VRLIREWINHGAVWPKDFAVKTHWSYVPPVRPELPAGNKATWPRNAIDNFVAARLQQQNLQPSAEAAPATLVRRLSLDLIGLPPSPAEVDAFVADPSDAAYAAIVDDLLQRPQFGERWARPWLDLARYADSHGFQRDDLREIWAYRDWVIQALNDDMPFDQFTIEQIAGDLLPNATEAQKVATGFHRCTPTNVEAGSLPEETRTEQVIDRVNTTGAVWLGTTLECCQCHDHKYDPFSAKDYYGLLAFYNNTQAEADRLDPKKPSSIAFKGPSMPLTDPEQEAERKKLTEEIALVETQLEDRREQLSSGLKKWLAQHSEQFLLPTKVHTLEVVDFQSTGNTDTHSVLPDGSVLLSGSDPPDRDTYVVTIRTELKNITAIQLDALAHRSLPGKGPGRGDAKRPNFVLSRFSGTIESIDDATDKEVALTFNTARSEFSQKNFEPVNALDEMPKPKSGWAIAPRFGKSHSARFLLKQPLDCSGGRTLTFRLVHDYGGARSIGRLKLSALTGNVDNQALPEDVIAAAAVTPQDWTKPQRKILLAFREQNDGTSQTLTTQIDELKAQQTAIKADTTLVMVELPESRMSYVFDRGDYRNKGEPVVAATPSVLHPMPHGPPNRTTLAHWLIDPANPLVGRVTVNRWWAEIFGLGIVSTVEDFAIKGEASSHPEHLDWLAVEFVDNNWSMKHILRTIVLSSTYRQSSTVSPQQQETDPTNQWLSRGARFRLDAEAIRDSVLTASGLISLKQFGPPIRPFQPDGIWSKIGGQKYPYEVSPGAEQHRRGIYVVLKRGAPYPSFVNFDASGRLACTVQRSRTNTPLQALTLLNDPVYVEASQALAKRVLMDRPNSGIKQQLTYAFQLCVARKPATEELNILEDLFESQRSVAQADAKVGSQDKLRTKQEHEINPSELTAWTAVATALINLHETITKN